MEFKDPPPPKGGRQASSKFNALAEKLREHPGEWALIVQDGHHNLVPRIKAGAIPAFRPEGAYDATSRASTGGKAGRFDVYARFVGDEVDFE